VEGLASEVNQFALTIGILIPQVLQLVAIRLAPILQTNHGEGWLRYDLRLHAVISLKSELYSSLTAVCHGFMSNPGMIRPGNGDLQ
jgi:hypothetical protein